MAVQPKIIACGNTIAAVTMAIRFLFGPAVMAATAAAVGLRGTLLRVAIVQVTIFNFCVKAFGLHVVTAKNSADFVCTYVLVGRSAARNCALCVRQGVQSARRRSLHRVNQAKQLAPFVLLLCRVVISELCFSVA